MTIPETRSMLPRLVVLTDRVSAGTRSRTLTETVREAIAGGARAIVVREKDLARMERRRLLEALRELLEPVGGRVGVASDVELALESGVDWVHLAQIDRRPDMGLALTIGRSCHGTAQAAQAVREDCHYVTVSPVALTVSKPGYGPALEHQGLAAACRSAGVTPAWALGGVTPENAFSWLEAGAFGVAVMGSVMGAPDPAAVTAAFLASLEGAA